VKIMKTITVDLSKIIDKSPSNPYPFALDFYRQDTNTFIVCSDQGIVKSNRFNHQDEFYPKEYRKQMLDFSFPTAISISDQGYILIGFSCGSLW
jgi:hypothetical protein